MDVPAANKKLDHSFIYIYSNLHVLSDGTRGPLLAARHGYFWLLLWYGRGAAGKQDPQRRTPLLYDIYCRFPPFLTMCVCISFAPLWQILDRL